MFRILAALGAVALSVAAASAQPGLPLSPGVTPASPIGPGTQFIRPQFNVGPTFSPNVAGLQILPVMSPYGYPTTPFYGNAVGPLNSFGSGFGYGYGVGYPAGGLFAAPPAINITQSVTNVSAGGPVSTVVPIKDLPATLTLQFPNAAEVWVNGKKADGDAATERVLTSPTLKVGESHTFEVKARWMSGGKTYEATRTVTLGAGDRSRLLIVSGVEVG